MIGQETISLSDWTNRAQLLLDAPQPLRLSFLCHEFPPLGGGAATALDQLTRTLAQRGHAIQIVTIGLGRASTMEADPAGRWVARLGVGRKKLLAPSAWHLWRSYRALKRQSHRLLSEFQPDAMVAYFAFPAGRAALSLQKNLQVPLVAFLRGSDVPGFSNARWGAFQKAQRFLVRDVWANADLLLANGQSLVRLAEAFMPERRPVNLANGVDTQRYYPPVRRTDGKTLDVLFVGQLIERKRCRELLAAMHWLDRHQVPARLTVAGDGPLRAELEAMAAKLSPRVQVQFAGPVARQRMAELYRGHEVLVHLSRAEGVSNVLLEGMASGLCVVASRPAAGEVCGDGEEHCVYLDAMTSERLGQTLAELAGDLDRRRQLQVAARTLAQQHQWSQVAARLEEHLEPLCPQIIPLRQHDVLRRPDTAGSTQKKAA